jgi:lipopolysaccharide export system protein LptA
MLRFQEFSRRNLGKMLLVLAALASALLSRVSPAESTPRRASASHGAPFQVAAEKLEVNADKLEIRGNRGVLLLDGNVRVRVGDLEVSCPHAEVAYDEAPKLRWAKGSGGVQAKLSGLEASAAALELNLEKRVLTLQSHVRVTRGRGFMTADSATIDLLTKNVSLSRVSGSLPLDALRP